MSEQQTTPKQQLVTLTQSLIAAHSSGDELLKQYAANAYTQFLNQFDLVALEAEEVEEAEEDRDP